jgi:hypothetical protein
MMDSFVEAQNNLNRMSYAGCVTLFKNAAKPRSSLLVHAYGHEVIGLKTYRGPKRKEQLGVCSLPGFYVPISAIRRIAMRLSQGFDLCLRRKGFSAKLPSYDAELSPGTSVDNSIALQAPSDAQARSGPATIRESDHPRLGLSAGYSESRIMTIRVSELFSPGN